MHTKQNNSLLPVLQSAPAPAGTQDKSFHPLGALLLHSLPQFILLLLWSWMLISFKSSLPETAKPFFYLSFSTMLIVWLVNGGAILYHFLARIQLSGAWIGTSLPLYLLLIVLYYTNLDQYDTLGVPAWQQPRDILYYTGSFLIPAVLHLLSLLAIRVSLRSSGNSRWKNILYAIVSPLLCYLMVMGAIGLRLPVEAEGYWLVLLITITTVASVFFLILGAIQLSKGSKIYRKPLTGLKILLTAILPVGCLLFNNGQLWDHASTADGIFGDFNHPVFYILALLNGLLISLPVEDLRFRRWFFLGRCMLFPFSLYFFFVLAPFMPLAVFLVIFFGLGLLLLVPIVVLSFHIKSLAQDLQELRSHYSLAKLAVAAALAFMVLPAGIYLNYAHDRVVLHRALDYLEDPMATEADVWLFSLRRTLGRVQGNKNRGNQWFDHRNTPLLSPWFSWQVLDGLSLSDQKVAQIKQIFLKEPLSREEQSFNFWQRPENGSVKLIDLSGQSRYDAENGYWVSEVALELRNGSQGWEEYLTQFTIPAGSWVSDYYLYLGDVKESGLLVERKAALWVYDQITRTRKDPGLLRYLPNGALELRVYPFTGEQSRKTGFSLLHKRPFSLEIDGRQLQLGDPEQASAAAPAFARTRYGAFIPAELKAQLPLIERRGYWHFIIDCSAGQEAQIDTYKSTLQDLMQRYPDLSKGAKVSFVGHSVNTFSMADAELESLWLEQSFRGGFYLERAFQSILLTHYKSRERDYPVPLVLSNAREKAVLPPTLLHLAFAMPEHKWYYAHDEAGMLRSYSLAYPKQETDSNTPPAPRYAALAWPDAVSPQAYLKDDGKDVILPLPVQDLWSSSGEISDWDKGLELWTRWQAASLYPGQDWKEQVMASFSAHVLSPHTAFMVVEEAWQKDMLLQKQEQFLQGHPAIDGSSELAEMPEPELWMLLVLFGGWLWWRRRKQGRIILAD